MRSLLLSLVLSTLICTVNGNSNDPAHFSRRENGVTDHELSTSASLFSALAHHHGYPYGWGLPINTGSAHEVQSVVHTRKHGHEHGDKDKTEECHRHWHLPCVDHINDVDEAFDGLE